MKDVLDFLSAALPWISIGLLLAIFFAQSARKKKEKKKNENFGTEGMALGMCFGTAIGTSLGNNTASVRTALKLGFVRSGEQYYEEFHGQKYLQYIYVKTLSEEVKKGHN